jgi:hypothetical protein
MLKLTRITGAICLAATFTLLGCGRSESTTSTPANSGDGMSGPAAEAEPRVYGSAAAGAPSFNAPASGMGFTVGDALHADGQGSGLMGFHQTGAAGTSGTITDRRIGPEQPDTTPHEQR